LLVLDFDGKNRAVHRCYDQSGVSKFAIHS